MADSVKDILRGYDSFPVGSSKGGDIDSRAYSTGSQAAPKSNNVDGPSIGSQNAAAKSQVASQSNQKGANQKDQQLSSGVAACLTMFNNSDQSALASVYDDGSCVGKTNPELNPIDKNYADLDYDADGPNALFFGEDRSSNAKDRGERVRQLRERQQIERQQKLQELKDQAEATHKFREQHDLLRRQRLDEMRQRDSDRRGQVEERRRLLMMNEHDRKEAALRRNSERDNRIELKKRQERSNVVFAFGSSTPRMLDPKESSFGYWGSRKATSSSNVNTPDASLMIRRPNLADSADLSRKRATSAHSLNRKPDDLRMSSSMYEVFHWSGQDGAVSSQGQPPPAAGTRLTKSRDSSLERRTRAARVERSLATTPEPPTQTPFFTTTAHTPSRFSVWEFGDNFSALGPAAQGRTPNSPNLVSPISSSSVPPPPTTPCGAKETAVGDNDIMSQSMTAGATTPTAARRRTDLFPVVLTSRPTATATTKGRHRASGMQSGSTTPNSSSRPASALSQGSSGNQVILRSKTAPRKPRPLTIAGSSFTYADKPRPTNAASLASRESRPIDRKSSVDSTTQSKLSRAKSASGSDSNVTATTKSASASRPTSTPKRTPAQVKAESAARKAAEKSKAAAHKRPTPPQQVADSPPSKPAPSQPVVVQSVEEKQPEQPSEQIRVQVEQPVADNAEPPAVVVDIPASEPSQLVESIPVPEFKPPSVSVDSDLAKVDSDPTKVDSDPTKVDSDPTKVDSDPAKVDSDSAKVDSDPAKVDSDPAKVDSDPVKVDSDPIKVDSDPAKVDRPTTGYANAEQYKAALAENRRLAREAREKELEVEKQRELEAREKEKSEEEEYLRLMEEQKVAEEDRLKKAIEEAKLQREQEAKQKEEEEIQRVEAEKIEKQKQLEAEEKMRQEEFERQARKSRVAAIMSRTRGKGAPKGDGKSPDELRGADNLTDSFMANISSSMSDSMIVEAIESRQNEGESEEPLVIAMIDTTTTKSSVVTEEISSVVSSAQKTEVVVVTSEHLNGDARIESSNGDLIGSVNGGVHNGAVTNGKSELTPANPFDSFDPFNPTLQSTTKDSQSFDEIIDLTQSKLTNEDVVNSNPPTPIIAFEENINKKQSQDASSTNVPDLLL